MDSLPPNANEIVWLDVLGEPNPGAGPIFLVPIILLCQFMFTADIQPLTAITPNPNSDLVFEPRIQFIKA